MQLADCHFVGLVRDMRSISAKFHGPVIRINDADRFLPVQCGFEYTAAERDQRTGGGRNNYRPLQEKRSILHEHISLPAHVKAIGHDVNGPSVQRRFKARAVMVDAVTPKRRYLDQLADRLDHQGRAGERERTAEKRSSRELHCAFRLLRRHLERPVAFDHLADDAAPQSRRHLLGAGRDEQRVAFTRFGIKPK